jgi:very-short-patch-repair endonuclease
MMGYQRTDLEQRMYDTLTDLSYEFAEQVSTFSGFVIDFAIYHNRQAGQMIAIEVDGAKWHSSPKRRRRDGFRTRILKREGWTVIRFGETFTAEEAEDRIAGVLSAWHPRPKWTYPGAGSSAVCWAGVWYGEVRCGMLRYGLV